MEINTWNHIKTISRTTQGQGHMTSSSAILAGVSCCFLKFTISKGYIPPLSTNKCLEDYIYALKVEAIQLPIPPLRM